MKHIIFFIIMFLLFGSIGQYVGSMVFLSIRGLPIGNASPLLLYEIFNYYQDDLLSSVAQQAFFISGAVSLAVMILPPLLMMIGLLIKPKASLHGDARFANDRELKPYIYKGDYQ